MIYNLSFFDLICILDKYVIHLKAWNEIDDIKIWVVDQT